MPLFYANLIDPLLAGARRLILDQVPEGASVLDAACGTGDLARQLARRCARVQGVELDRDMVVYASRRAGPRERYLLADASALELPDDAFDLATLSMALHEMPPDRRVPVLTELLRVAPVVLVVDYAIPLPPVPTSLGVRLIERMAGVEHHAGFRSFREAGGVEPLAAQVGRGQRLGTALSGCVALWRIVRS